METVVFDTGRSDYYKKKKSQRQQEEKDRQLVAEDAVYIKHYGMDAYLRLFPEAKDFPISWHRAVVKELQRLERQSLANTLNGFALASAAKYGKKAGKAFRSLIKDLTKWVLYNGGIWE